jgi:hypothetical protein
MTLDEMLALLPDNSAGEISASDLREIVSGLWEVLVDASVRSAAYKYTKTLGLTPGQVGLQPAWVDTANVLQVSDSVTSGAVPPLDLWTEGDPTGMRGRLRGVTDPGVAVEFLITGPATLITNGRTLPIHIESIPSTVSNVPFQGSEPGSGDAMVIDYVPVS